MKQKVTLLQIAELGQPVIRKKASRVKKIDDPLIGQLIDDLTATVKEVDGVGIAAPQVYKSLQLFILASHPNKRYPKAPKMKPHAVINPKIISYSQKTEKGWEGCLSIPGIRGLVPRHESIEVEYSTREGGKTRKRFKGFVAKIFQHEFDHIQGTVFLDRLDSSKDIITEKEYQRALRSKI